MAIIGCSVLKYAKYANSGTTITYSDGGVAAKLVSLEISIDAATDNDFYADNAVDETDRVFAGGSLTVGTNDLTDAVSKAILGLQEAALETITGISDTGVKEIFYDGRQVIPWLGLGMVVKHQRNGAAAWTAIVLPKCMFAVPNDSAETQGKTISWQTPSLTASITRDDSANQVWKRQATFTTEAQAVAYIDARLGIS